MDPGVPIFYGGPNCLGNVDPGFIFHGGPYSIWIPVMLLRGGLQARMWHTVQGVAGCGLICNMQDGLRVKWYSWGAGAGSDFQTALGFTEFIRTT